MKITKLETFLVKPRWIFLKIHTDEGLVGLGEPILEGRAPMRAFCELLSAQWWRADS